MQIIPVIDLKAGHVVHAKFGDRAHYRPLNTALCQSSNIVDVIEAYLALYPFTRCYIADLDAITGTGNHQIIIDDLVTQYPDLEFIVDAGFHDDIFFSRNYPANYFPVLASECLNTAFLPKIINNINHRFILSLDYSLAKNLGPEPLFNDPRFWPKNIIIMPLNSVGSFQGPDVTRLQNYRSHNNNYNIIAAGGVRNIQDLEQLKNIGVHSVLVASALHSLAINQQDLQKLCSTR